MLTEYITAAFLMFGIICFGCIAGRVILNVFCTPKTRN